MSSRIEQEIKDVVQGVPPDRRRRRRSNPGSDHERTWRGSRVQVLLFNADQWTQRQAIAWARRHDFQASKVHRTEHYIRIRQFDPTPGAPKRTIQFGGDEVGIRAVVEAF